MRRIITLVAVAALAACQRQETAEQKQMRMETESGAFQQVIADRAEQYERYTATNNFDSLVMLYTENAVEMPPNEPARTGRDAIRAAADGMGKIYSQKLDIQPVSSSASGSIGVDRGTFTAELTPAAGAPRGTRPMKDAGKYLAHWHKVGDQWLLAELIWSSDSAAPPPPPRRS